MARAELRRERAVLRQRQETTRRDQSLAANDRRTVMQRRIRNEHIHQKIRRDKAVDLDARRTDIVEPHVALDDEQRADLIRRENLYRAANLTDRALRLLIVEKRAGAEKLALSEMLQCAAQLRLKNNRERDKEQRHRLLQEPRNHVQIQVIRHNRYTEQDENPLAERNGARILQHHVDTIKNDRHDQDVQYIQRRDGRKDAAKLRRHRKIKWHGNPPRSKHPIPFASRFYILTLLAKWEKSL